MPVFFQPLIAFAVALAVTWAAVPLITRVAIHRKLLDYPDGDRHHHTKPVPRLGGVAVFAGLLAALLAAAATSKDLGVLSPWLERENQALLAASVILFLVGLMDDLRGVKPLLKLLCQTIAALIVVSAGYVVRTVSLVPGTELELGLAAVPVTVLWLVGVSNAFNLIDGVDGLAGGVGVIALAAITASAAALGNSTVAGYALALVGALLGFLRYNWNPARIFLGDSGSLVVGFLLAILSVKGATNSDGVLYVLVPLFALSYLLLDTGIAMMRRWLRGEPLSRADGRHIHHRLLGLGLPPAKAVSLIYSKSLFIALLGLCVTFVPPAMTVAIAAMGGAILLLIMVYGIRWLDYHEFLEAGASLASGLRKARRVIQDRIRARDVAQAIAKISTPDQLHRILQEQAPAFRFAHMDVRPGADADRHDVADVDRTGAWRLDYPINCRTLLIEPHGSSIPTAVLRIWCPIASPVRIANAERVAEILAPAIAIALQNVDHTLPFERHAPMLEPPMTQKHRRASGGFRSRHPLS